VIYKSTHLRLFCGNGTAFFEEIGSWLKPNVGVPVNHGFKAVVIDLVNVLARP